MTLMPFRFGNTLLSFLAGLLYLYGIRICRHMGLSYVASTHSQPSINWHEDMAHESGNGGQRTPHSDKVFDAWLDERAGRTKGHSE